MPKKLYECTVKYTYYAYAENEADALRFADDAIRDNDATTAFASEVSSRAWSVDADWDDGCLVYAKGDEVTLGTLLAALPEKPAR